MTRERIEDMRRAVLPFVKKKLAEINYEGQGKRDVEEFEKDFNELLNLAIKALEQEPCEDAVSREQVLLALTGKNLSTKNTEELISLFNKRIKALPPVTPTRKKGKWIEERDDYGNITGWHCSNCYEDSGFTTTCKWDFCPNCGAEMESEE